MPRLARLVGEAEGIDAEIAALAKLDGSGASRIQSMKARVSG